MMTDDKIMNQITAEWVKSKLSPADWELLYLKGVEELTYDEIGKIIGLKYEGKELTGSAMRYRKDRIRKDLIEMGLEQ